MSDPTFTRSQLRRGVVLLLAFVVMRAVLVRLPWTRTDPGDPTGFALLVAVSFLVGSVGLVYLGFTRWVGVELADWWVERERLRGDVLWGLAGFVVALAGTALTVVVLGPLLGTIQGEPPAVAAPTLTGTLLQLAFGFAVASFQEETLFRGFLQPVLAERVGARPAVLLQAVAFSAAHVGYYPLAAWYLFAVAFVGGLVFGWLRHRRGRLLAPGIAHGLVG